MAPPKSTISSDEKGRRQWVIVMRFPGEKTSAKGRLRIVYLALLGVILALILYRPLVLLRPALEF
ncbi:MAG: hypothetical protein ABSD38_09650 [Syntrophorhabdales bacterium]